MRVKLSSVDEINKILRNIIIQQTGLKENVVVNGYSIHGADLETQLNKYCVNSYEPKDSYIVFELQAKDEYITETDYSGNLTINSAYRMHLYIYGNNHHEIVNKLIARLLTDNIRLELQNQGIYLESITDKMNGTDFINDTLFPRTDFNINIYCEQEIAQDDDYDIEKLSKDIQIIKEDNNG